MRLAACPQVLTVEAHHAHRSHPGHTTGHTTDQSHFWSHQTQVLTVEAHHAHGPPVVVIRSEGFHMPRNDTEMLLQSHVEGEGRWSEGEGRWSEGGCRATTPRCCCRATWKMREVGRNVVGRKMGERRWLEAGPHMLLLHTEISGRECISLRV